MHEAKIERIEEMDYSIIIIGDSNNSLLTIAKTTRQKFNKSIKDLANTVSELHQREIKKTIHSTMGDMQFLKHVRNIFQDSPHAESYVVFIIITFYLMVFIF